ncbi:MAG: exo-alpha-sialidase [Euryarchaeota archaeon]|nr:exo-alpha-sialidase [Euryarchaeota archaeon]
MNRMTLAALVAAMTLAGCTGQVEIGALDVKDIVPKFTDYHWPPPVVTNGTGAIQPGHLLLADPTQIPHYVQQMLPRETGEPNIGVTTKGNLFVSTFDDVQRSKDGGKTWEVVHSLQSPLVPTSVDYWNTGDPMLWVDSDTDRIFASHLSDCTFLGWSDDEGASWQENSQACLTPSIDHQKVATAKYGPKTLVAPPVKPYPNVVYICYNKGLSSLVADKVTTGVWCMVSYDGGRTIDQEQQVVPGVDFCPGINGHPHPFPDGTMIVPVGLNWDSRCPRPITVTYSEDNGVTWNPRYMPGKDRMVEIDPEITVTPNGIAYLMYRDQDQVVKLVRSKDKFTTWEGPWRISPADQTLNVFTVMASGDNGRISLAYLGTRTPQAKGTDPSFANQHTEWHLFVSTVFDAEAAEPIFVTQQVTPEEDPVQMGCVWLQGGNGGPHRCRNMYDFIDMVHDEDGRGFVAFTDGCTPRNGCTGDRYTLGQSRDSQGGIAVQVSGPSLFSSVGLLPELEGYEHPRPLGKQNP